MTRPHLTRRKKTLPIVYALQCARQEDIPLLRDWANTTQPLNRDNEAVMAAIRDLGGLHFTWVVAAYERRAALAVLEALALRVDREEVRALVDLLPVVALEVR